jgi:hypothetical protein
MVFIVISFFYQFRYWLCTVLDIWSGWSFCLDSIGVLFIEKLLQIRPPFCPFAEHGLFDSVGGPTVTQMRC